MMSIEQVIVQKRNGKKIELKSLEGVCVCVGGVWLRAGGKGKPI